MNRIKAKRIQKAADAIRTLYPTLAAELDMLVTSSLNVPHSGGKAKMTASLESALSDILKKMPNSVLAGGFAVLHWVDIRKTYDLDFVVLGEDFNKMRSVYPEGSMKHLIYTVKVDGEDVDFLNPSQFAWTDEAIRASKPIELLGHKVKVVTPEYLILYKFSAGRDKDFSDIKGLMTLPGVTSKARDLIGKYMPEEIEDFDALAMEAEYGL